MIKVYELDAINNKLKDISQITPGVSGYPNCLRLPQLSQITRVSVYLQFILFLTFSSNKRPSKEAPPSPKRLREEPDMTMCNNKTCPQCSKKFHTNYELDRHVQKDHPYNGVSFQVGEGLIKIYLSLTKSLYSGLINFYQLGADNNNRFKDLLQFLYSQYTQ